MRSPCRSATWSCAPPPPCRQAFSLSCPPQVLPMPRHLQLRRQLRLQGQKKQLLQEGRGLCSSFGVWHYGLRCLSLSCYCCYCQVCLRLALKVPAAQESLRLSLQEWILLLLPMLQRDLHVGTYYGQERPPHCSPTLPGSAAWPAEQHHCGLQPQRKGHGQHSGSLHAARTPVQHDHWCWWCPLCATSHCLHGCPSFSGIRQDRLQEAEMNFFSWGLVSANRS